MRTEHAPARAMLPLLALAAAGSQIPLVSLVLLGFDELVPALLAAGIGAVLCALVIARPGPRRRPPSAPPRGSATDIDVESGAMTLGALSSVSTDAVAPHGGTAALMALDLGLCGVDGPALSRLVSSLRMCLRRCDLVARVDERRFVVLMPGLAEVDASAVAARMRLALSRRAPLMGAAAPVPLCIVPLMPGERLDRAAERADALLREEDEGTYAETWAG